MFERFSGPARTVLRFAQDEALQLRQPAIGTEHLLLGVLREETSRGARFLLSLGLSLEEARTYVLEAEGRGAAHPVGHVPFTAGAKNVLDLALRVARNLGQSYVGTEHLLIAIEQERNGVGAQLLATWNFDVERLQHEMEGELEDGPRRAAPRFSAHIFGDDEIPPSEPRFLGVRLLRAIPVVARLSPDIILASIELYQDGVAVRFTTTVAGQIPDRDSAMIVSDDVDTHYQLAGGGWIGGDFLRGEWNYVPTPPEQATVLRVRLSAEGETQVAL
jgi:Clp amino terminal domain, pathogenicity island component